MTKRKLICTMVASAALLAMPGAVFAQESPKVIRFVVPYAPGGLPDTVARIVAQHLQQNSGKTVVVENRPGANGAVAAAALATSPADGSTFLVTDGSMITINPLITKNMSYNPDKDLVPVSLIATSPLFLATNANVKANTLDEFIKLAKANGASMNYGSSGIGSSHHLAMEALKAGLGIPLQHIPYKGSGASVPALVGSQVDVVYSAYPSLAGFAKDGKVKILATNSATRSSLAPNVPAVAEKLPGYDFAVRVIALARAGTPQPVIQTMSSEIAKVVKEADVVSKFKSAGIEPVGGSPAQLEEALKAEKERMAVAGKQAHLLPE
ncbi:Tripartite-type tricarboxylate transporter, receptor component TctC [Noviherbaspirillum humi]|uniref:Tripartite-type tricarboxylate transporter, receptor component TctC n=2 Tax=Noviherbaspirillum humi TaxID=1688639 RepID=A0A239F159_9BURK|nr:Tripartite-type tricarboxylate transporter, receptor component TctC [Noviherbaspirillum humi]